MLFLVTMMPVYAFLSLVFLLVNSAFYIVTTVRLLKIHRIEGNEKVFGIISYLSSLYLIHLSSFICLTISGEIPRFIRPHNAAEVLLLFSRLSLFVTVPLFIHSLFPTPWSRIIQWILSLLGAGLAVISYSEILPPVSFTIGTYTLLIVLGGYALIYGFIASLHIPRKTFLGSRELGYSFVALGAFVIFVPFMFPSDFTFIPQGFLEDRFYFFPYHSLAVIIGFFFITIRRKGHWIDEPLFSLKLPAESVPTDPSEVIREYGLSKRESEIFLLLIEHKSYKEIANTLCISMATAKTHIINLYRKLGINKKSQLPGIIHKIPGSE